MKLLSSACVLATALALASLAPQPTTAADSCGSGACLTNYDPVCGSDGKTYSNACELSRAKCTNTSLTQKSTGECSSSAAGSSSTGTGTCAQEFACLSVYDPVCGSDNKTYTNACELKRATCANPAVVLKSTGECPGSSSSSTGSTGGGGGATICKIKACTKEYKPVCGSDNKTYANKCTFTNAQCETPALTLKAEVACEGDDVDDSVGGDADVSSLSGSSDDDACVTMCTKEYTPVCGSNGLTYENACLLKNAQCSNATLSKTADSACPTAAPTTGSAANPTATVGIQVAALAVLSAVASLML